MRVLERDGGRVPPSGGQGPGWVWLPREGRYGWFDGRDVTRARVVWTEDGWRQYVVEPPSRSTRAWWWVLGLVVVLGSVVFVLVYALALQQQALVYGFEEDFSLGAGPFPVAESELQYSRVQDGAYVLGSTDSRWAAEGFVRTPWTGVERVELQAEMTLESGEGAGFGLLVDRGDRNAYLFSVWPGAHAEIASQGSSGWVVRAEGASGIVDSGGELQMVVEAGDDATTVIGYLDGSEVVRLVDTEFVISRCPGVGVVVIAGDEPAVVSVDSFSAYPY